MLADTDNKLPGVWHRCLDYKCTDISKNLPRILRSSEFYSCYCIVFSLLNYIYTGRVNNASQCIHNYTASMHYCTHCMSLAITTLHTCPLLVEYARRQASSQPSWRGHLDPSNHSLAVAGQPARTSSCLPTTCSPRACRCSVSPAHNAALAKGRQSCTVQNPDTSLSDVDFQTHSAILHGYCNIKVVVQPVKTLAIDSSYTAV